MAQMYVDQIVEHLRCLVPHSFNQARPAHDFAGAPHQHFEDREFFRGQRDRSACAGHPATRRIQREIVDSEHRRPCVARPPEQRADPRQKLGEGERLGEVIIGAGAQTLDPIGQAVPRGQHQDRRRQVTRTQCVTDGNAVLPWQEPVEHDHVVLVHGGLLFALLTGRGHIDDEPFFVEPLGEKLRRLTIVLDQENTHRPYPSEPRGLWHDPNKIIPSGNLQAPPTMLPRKSWPGRGGSTMESRPMPLTSRRHLLKLGGAVAAASVLGLQHAESLADGDPPPAKAKQPDRGGTFRMRIGQSPAHFDPHQTSAYSTMVPLSFAYSRLVMIKPGSSIVPGTQPLDSDLAQSWDRLGDTVYLFRLRPGVRWQPKPPVNGRELTADDVKYTYERFLATKGNPNRTVLEMVDKVEAPDKYTVKFTLKEPNAWFVDRLASTSTWIIARECVEKYGDLKKWESVVGTGPWMLDRYESGARLTFVRNPN